MLSYLTSFLFPLIPVAALVWAIVSTALFFSARKHHKNNPDEASEQRLYHRRILMILSLATCGVMLVCLLAVVALTFMAVAYM